jgi:hypothetical protein
MHICSKKHNHAAIFLLAFLSFQVTDDLFDEIATKVMNENDSADECE